MNCFKYILEQDRALNEFYNSFEQDRLNHAYLLVGERGIGKSTLARAVAARYLCQNPIDNDSCGSCRSCSLLNSGNHPDFLELPREPNELRIRRFTPRAGVSNESIDHQTVLEFMRLKPMNGGGRVCIIPDIERINIEAANAFLKTLEEPPPQSLILLTSSNKDRLLSTINSRCRIIGMSPLSQECIINFLIKSEGLDPSEAQQLTNISEGSLGSALDLSGGEALENWRHICNISNYNSAAEAVRFARELTQRVKKSKNASEKRETVLNILDLLALYVRRALREGLSPRKGYKALNSLWDAGDILCANVRPELVTLNAVISTVTALHKG